MRLYKNNVAAIRASGRIISKKRGSANNVKTQKELLVAPDSMTNSKNRNDWVKNTTTASVIAIKIVAIVKFLNI